MKNKILYLVALCVAVTLAGCQKITTEGMTRITYYPEITLEGGPAIVYLGETTVPEEGYSATMAGEDVTEQLTITSNINPNVIGVYNKTYSLVNDDGFPGSARRTVYVVDPSTIPNLYLGESQTATRHYTGAPIFITDNGDGTYKVDDIIGGYQFYGVNPGFEPTYDFHAEANIAINADNTLSMVGNVGSWYFGDTGTVVALTSGTFDPATRTFVLNLSYGGTPLTVTLHSITK